LVTIGCIYVRSTVKRPNNNNNNVQHFTCVSYICKCKHTHTHMHTQLPLTGFLFWSHCMLGRVVQNSISWEIRSGISTEGWWRWALVSPDGVAPSRMVGVSACVNLPLHRKVQKFSSCTVSPEWSWKKGRKTYVCMYFYRPKCSSHQSTNVTAFKGCKR